MRIPVALLAEYAVVKADGTFYVVAGGFDTVEFPAYPRTLDRLSLAVKAALEPSERSTPNVITLQFEGPHGKPFGPSIDVTVAPNSGALLPPVVNFVYNLSQARLEAPGGYTVRLLVKGAEVASASFQARVRESGIAPTQSRIDSYREAFFAYRDGDFASAERVFRTLADENPSWAAARNALGFLQLAKGEASAALENFLAARQLGVGLPEIVDVNIACCHYLLGDWQRALDGLEYALRAHTISMPPILLVTLTGDGVARTELNTPGEYMALVALNAGWCALRIGQVQAARRHLNLCRATIDDEGAPRQIVESLALAEQRLAQPPPKPGLP